MSRRLLPLGAFVLALVAACGGGTAPASPAVEPDAPAATDAAAPAPTDAAAPNEPQASAGGVLGDLTPGTTLNACEIVTADDIKVATATTDAVATGALVAKPDVLSPNKTECRYEGDYGRIIVQLVPEDGANVYDAARGAYKDASDITGIGDGAFHSTQNHRAFVWQDKVNVMLTMFLNGDLDQLPVATSLGNAIVDKL